MNSSFIKLYVVFGLFWANFFLIPVLGYYANSLVGYSIFTLFIVLLPLYVLCSKDVLEHLSTVSLSKKHTYVAWLIASLPTLLFGLLAVGIAIAIILWVLYNFLIERQPEFTGGAIFSGFGIAPVMLYFGLRSLKTLWVKSSNA